MGTSPGKVVSGENGRVSVLAYPASGEVGVTAALTAEPDFVTVSLGTVESIRLARYLLEAVCGD